jgi:serine/threonine-protein kinase
LIFFQGVPPQQDSGQTAVAPADWTPLFDAAGLDRSRWTETTSQEIPMFGFDERKAWTGSYAHAPDMPLRIEAASWKGRPVSFELFGPWRQPVGVQRSTTAQTRQVWIRNGFTALLLLVAAWLAWRNYRAGRADVSNAARLAAIGFVGQSLSGIVVMHHVPTPMEVSHVVDAVGFGLFVAAMAGVFYLALEPFVRRRWPQTLISWTRLLAGDARDPLVAGHILIGVTFGVALAILQNGMDWYRFEVDGVIRLEGNRISVLDARRMTAFLLSGLIQPTAIIMGVVFLIILLRLALRHTWVVVAAVVALATLSDSARGGGGAILVVGFVVINALRVWATLGFGILPGTLTVIFSTATGTLALTSDFSAWYASLSLFIVALTLGLAIWSFRHALAGRRVLSESFFEA